MLTRVISLMTFLSFLGVNSQAQASIPVKDILEAGKMFYDMGETATPIFVNFFSKTKKKYKAWKAKKSAKKAAKNVYKNPLLMKFEDDVSDDFEQLRFVSRYRSNLSLLEDMNSYPSLHSSAFYHSSLSEAEDDSESYFDLHFTPRYPGSSVRKDDDSEN